MQGAEAVYQQRTGRNCSSTGSSTSFMSNSLFRNKPGAAQRRISHPGPSGPPSAGPALDNPPGQWTVLVHALAQSLSDLKERDLINDELKRIDKAAILEPQLAAKRKQEIESSKQQWLAKSNAQAMQMASIFQNIVASSLHAAVDNANSKILEENRQLKAELQTLTTRLGNLESKPAPSAQSTAPFEPNFQLNPADALRPASAKSAPAPLKPSTSTSASPQVRPATLPSASGKQLTLSSINDKLDINVKDLFQFNAQYEKDFERVKDRLRVIEEILKIPSKSSSTRSATSTTIAATTQAADPRRPLTKPASNGSATNGSNSVDHAGQTAKFATLSNKLQETEDRIRDIQAKLSKCLVAHDITVNEHKPKLSNFDPDTIVKSIGDIKDSLNTLPEWKEKTTEQISDHTRRIVKLEESTALRDAVGRIKGQIDALNSDITSIRSSIPTTVAPTVDSQAQNKLEQIEKTIRELTKSCEDVKSRHDAFSTTQEELETQMAKFHKDTATIPSRMSEMREHFNAQMEQIKQSCDGVAKEQDHLTGRMAQAKIAIEKLTEFMEILWTCTGPTTVPGDVGHGHHRPL